MSIPQNATIFRPCESIMCFGFHPEQPVLCDHSPQVHRCCNNVICVETNFEFDISDHNKSSSNISNNGSFVDLVSHKYCKSCKACNIHISYLCLKFWVIHNINAWYILCGFQKFFFLFVLKKEKKTVCGFCLTMIM